MLILLFGTHTLVQAKVGESYCYATFRAGACEGFFHEDIY